MNFFKYLYNLLTPRKIQEIERINNGENRPEQIDAFISLLPAGEISFFAHFQYGSEWKWENLTVCKVKRENVRKEIDRLFKEFVLKNNFTPRKLKKVHLKFELLHDQYALSTSRYSLSQFKLDPYKLNLGYYEIL